MSQLSRELHDQFTGIATTLNHYFAFAADASAFYTEQAKLEREHATALRALISTAFGQQALSSDKDDRKDARKACKARSIHNWRRQPIYTDSRWR